MPSKKVFLVFAAVLFTVSVALAEPVPSRLWYLKWSSSGNYADYLEGLSAYGSTYIYGAGETMGSLKSGYTNKGSYDIFIYKFNASDGSVVWIDMFGTAQADSICGIREVADESIYIGGHTAGSLFKTNAGSTDPILAKYDSSGNRQWGVQFGSAGADTSYSMTVHGSAIYTGGMTAGNMYATNAGSTDAWLAKYDTSGNFIWGKQFGSTGAESGGYVTTDSLGNVYIAGTAGGNVFAPPIGGTDVYLAKYAEDGTLLLSLQFGTTANDTARDVVVDSLGNIYIVGSTAGVMGKQNYGAVDGFLAKLDASGGLSWVTQIGSATDDCVTSVAFDAGDNVLVGGYTNGAVFGPNLGDYDGILAKYDSSGDLCWGTQYEGNRREIPPACDALAVDALGYIYICGYIREGGSSAYDNIYMAKYIPEPSSMILLACGLFGLLAYAWRKQR